MFFEDTTAVRMYVRTDGGIGNFSANDVNLSDASTKIITGDLSPQSTLFRKLEIKTGRYKDSTEKQDIPFLTAQNVQTVYPGAVTMFDEKNGLLGVREHAIQMSAYKVIQELIDEVAALKARLATLEAR